MVTRYCTDRHIYLVRVRVENGELVEIGDDPDPPASR